MGEAGPRSWQSHAHDPRLTLLAHRQTGPDHGSTLSPKPAETWRPDEPTNLTRCLSDLDRDIAEVEDKLRLRPKLGTGHEGGQARTPRTGG